MDPIVIAVILVVVMPLGTLWALSKSAQLRGPLSRPESKKRVGSLVTEAIPEEHPDEDDVDHVPGPRFSIDSPPPEPDDPPRGWSSPPPEPDERLRG